MHLNNDANFWKKKEFLSFILSILVLFIHSHFAESVTCNSLISVVNQKVSYFFSVSITRFAVPMFFMMSGIAFFKGYNNKKYLSKIKNRIFTLVIPYLIWNTIWMIWEFFTSYSFISKFSVNSEPYPLTIISILKGIFFYGCNNPFWFIFDLIIFSFAAPIVFAIIKNKYIGIISVICLPIVSLFGIHIPINIFYYPMSIVFYIVGAIIGYHFFDFASKKSSKAMQYASFIFLIAYILTKNIIPDYLHIDNYLTQTIVYILAAFSLWNITDSFIEKIKPRAIYRRSFAIYAMHLNVAIIILKILGFCMPQSEWLEITKFIIMVVLTIVIINYICTFLEMFAPKIYSVLMGNRISKNKQNF